MARKNRNNQQPAKVENTEEASTQESNMSNENENEAVANTSDAAAVTEPKVDERYKMLTLSDGTQEKRKDYILRRWTVDKVSRGQIAKELSELSGKKVPYQIVFAATKGVAGGPDKTVTPAAPAETSAAAE